MTEQKNYPETGSVSGMAAVTSGSGALPASEPHVRATAVRENRTSDRPSFTNASEDDRRRLRSMGWRTEPEPAATDPLRQVASARQPSLASRAKAGAGEGNRTLVISLEGCCSTIELHPLSKGGIPTFERPV